MARTNFHSVDDYIASQPKAAQDILDRVRGAIRTALPRAKEVISYQIPAYKLHGDPVIYFAGWRKHYSLYPATEGVASAFKSDLAPYEIRNATIRFPLSEPVPVRLIGRIAKFRAREAAMRAKVKTKGTGRAKTKAVTPKTKR